MTAAQAMDLPEHWPAGEPHLSPMGRARMEAGELTFELWLEEDEEQLQLGQMLLSACPAEFLCPISLDIMVEPIILVTSIPPSSP